MNNYKKNINKLILLQNNLLINNINNKEVSNSINNFIEDKYNIMNKKYNKYNNKKKNENKLNIKKNNNLDNINFID